MAWVRRLLLARLRDNRHDFFQVTMVVARINSSLAKVPGEIHQHSQLYKAPYVRILFSIRCISSMFKSLLLVNAPIFLRHFLLVTMHEVCHDDAVTATSQVTCAFSVVSEARDTWFASGFVQLRTKEIETAGNAAYSMQQRTRT